MRLTDDWQGADFVVQHMDGKTFLKVQLKTRLTFCKKYRRKGIWVAFHRKGDWYLYPHDELLEVILADKRVQKTESSKKAGTYHFPFISKKLRELLTPYQIAGNVRAVE